MRSFIRVNHRIRVPQVRCIDSDGTMVGVVPTRDALALANKRGLDLVEVSPNASPPVCRVMDFGKYKYEESVKQKKTRKQSQVKSRPTKEVKFHANIGDHDYSFKVDHIKEFLSKGHKVKISLQFRGRENAHRDLGFEVMNRVIKDCADVASIDMFPRMMGNSIVAMLGIKSVKNREQRVPRAENTRPAQASLRPDPAKVLAPQS